VGGSGSEVGFGEAVATVDVVAVGSGSKVGVTVDGTVGMNSV